jgi:nitrite reductase/ring-hydroxylating ferredoxin subunit
LPTRARYFDAELDERTLVAGDDARLGETRFADWLKQPEHLTPRPSPRTGAAAPTERTALEDNEFRVSDVPPGSVRLVSGVAVFNVAGTCYATQNECTHARGPLSEGKLDGSTVTCPYHGSQFDVSPGAVLFGPARDPLRTYRVTVKDGIGRVEPD